MYTDRESLPALIPDAGFYYHYKHDPHNGLFDKAYWIFGAGHNTEDDVPELFQNFQNYVPLYQDAFVFVNGKMMDNRPLSMALGTVAVDGIQVPRFARITDETLIRIMTIRMKEMWGHLVPW